MQIIWLDIAQWEMLVLYNAIWKNESLYHEVLMNFNGNVAMTQDTIVYPRIFWKTCIISYTASQFY